MRVIYSIDRPDLALDLLSSFRDRYPAQSILRAFRPTPDLGHKVRLSSPSTTLEDDVPPHILFHDVDILHQRLVRNGDIKSVGKVKWITVSYESALRKRRNMRLGNGGYERQ